MTKHFKAVLLLVATLVVAARPRPRTDGGGQAWREELWIRPAL